MILSMMMCMVLCGIDFPVRDTLPEAEESATYAEAKARPATLVVFWNLENFFDWKTAGRGSPTGSSRPVGSGIGQPRNSTGRPILRPRPFSG